jgi:hypothetical protein
VSGHALPHEPQLVALWFTQAPLQHILPAPQTLPQAPQLLRSVSRLLQPLAQHVCDPLHGLPPAQVQAVPWQALPLVHGGTQLVPTHSPWLHASLAPQARPQVPQFCGSAARSKHAVPQQVSLPTQAGPPAQEHWPITHCSPALHRIPQPPQLKPSWEVFAQTPPQHVCPAPQSEAPQTH